MEFYYKNFDKMTQIVYPEPLVSLRSNSNISNQNPLYEEPVAISTTDFADYNVALGLNISETDLHFYKTILLQYFNKKCLN